MFNNGVFSQAIIKCMSKQKNHQPLDRLLEIARAHEIQGPAALARRLGETEQTVTNWGSRGVSKQGAMKAQAEFGVSANWLLTGIGPKFVMGGEKPALIDLDNNPDYPAIRRVRFKLSAGASGYGVEYSEDQGAPIVFGKAWYASNGYKPESLFAVKVANGSMEPGLFDGDTVVVNTDLKTPKDGIAFAVNYEGELVIKRLIRDAGQWWLSSDNPDQRKYPRKVCDENCEIIGRIVHKQSEHI
jgi:phage repressor protein C with HTH and peptisase S24 domain